jgi:hypothetical protein
VLLKLAQAVSRQLPFSRRPLAASKYSNCRRQQERKTADASLLCRTHGSAS